MIDHTMYQFLNIIVVQLHEINDLRNKWVAEMQSSFTLKDNNESIFNDLFFQIKNNLVELEYIKIIKASDNRIMISITLDGLKEYANYYNQLIVPKATLHIAETSNKIANDSLKSSKKSNLIALIAIIPGALALGWQLWEFIYNFFFYT